MEMAATNDYTLVSVSNEYELIDFQTFSLFSYDAAWQYYVIGIKYICY
jgi:hypothetical protein